MAKSSDDQLYHNHYLPPGAIGGVIDGRSLVPGWQGWTDLNGNFSGSVTLSAGRMSAFAAAVDRSGKIATVSIAQPSTLDSNTQQLLFYNSYETERFGTQPWNTVLWRGAEQTGSQRFVGQPALALIDRDFDLAYIDASLTAQHARLAETNGSTFYGVDNSLSINSSAPVDPVIVSSIPGKLDSLLIGADGRLRHVRGGERGSSSTMLLPNPSGATFNTQPAMVGYGSGQLEVVARAQSGALYHWRFQNGTWSSATALSGATLSQPILVHLGVGQLLALAVGSNQQLYTWYFWNGVWSSARLFTTSFAINPMRFGPMSASSWGDGSVDLALVSAANGAMYHGRLGAAAVIGTAFSFSLTPGKSFSSLGGVITDTPLLTAFGPTRISILSMGTDNAVYSAESSRDTSHTNPPNQAPDIVWVNYDYLGGENLLLGGVIKTGPFEASAVAIDPAGRVMVSRYSASRWIQYQPVAGQNLMTLLSPLRYRPAVTSLSE
jgi:hypothetical protein